MTRRITRAALITPLHYRPLGRTGLNVSVLSFGASSLGGVFRAPRAYAAARRAAA